MKHRMEVLFIILLTVTIFIVPETPLGRWLIGCSLILIVMYLLYCEDADGDNGGEQ